MNSISSLLRRPAAASILSLIGVLLFYVVIGGVGTVIVLVFFMLDDINAHLGKLGHDVFDLL